MSFNYSSSNQISLLDKKLRELKLGLSNGSRKLFPELLTTEEQKTQLFKFSEKLIQRASCNYLANIDNTTLTLIVKESFEFYLSCLTTDEPQKQPNCRIYNPSDPNRQHITAINTSVVDRPFLVDSLSECFNNLQIVPEVFLHPIVANSLTSANTSENYSVCYIEIPRIRDEDIPSFELIINNVLKDIILVTDDFSAMKKEALEAALSIQENGFGLSVPAEDKYEIGEFLNWLTNNGLVFLGSCSWKILNDRSLSLEEDKSLGLFRSTHGAVREELQCLKEDALYVQNNDNPIHFGKLFFESPVHRHLRTDAIVIHMKGSIYCILGFFTSQADAQKPSSLPIIRKRVREIIKKEGTLPSSYDHKEIINIIDSIPKIELLQHRAETLRNDILLIMNAQQQNRVFISLYTDAMERFVYLTVILPRERFSDDILKSIVKEIAEHFDSPTGSLEFHLKALDSPVIRIHTCFPKPQAKLESFDFQDLENHITEIAHTWTDRVVEIIKTDNEIDFFKLDKEFIASFPSRYQASTTPEEAAFDIKMLLKLKSELSTDLALRPTEDDGEKGYIDLRIYRRGQELTLSSILPYLENVGFEIGAETLTRIRPSSHPEKCWAIYNLKVRHRDGYDLESAFGNTILHQGLKEVFSGNAENDLLNQLLLNPGLKTREIAVVRALQHYLWQIKIAASERVIGRALIVNPQSTKLLIDYFNARFDPELFEDNEQNRNAALDEIRCQFFSSLKQVSRITHDRVLRSVLNLIDSTIRTNYFRLQDSDLRIALKIDCNSILQMPNPRPAYEIFVSDPKFSGVHLRGGKVARGGLRWSERIEDYRTEILGLMKTQTVKNAIIVPVGAKGGFVLKHKPSDLDALRNEVKSAYCQFIRSLLELTDNRVAGKVVHPPKTVIYDNEDPYLVVAADKGTATFSDTANDIAQNEFNFWLKDAFASGGSYGYDHKKLGITAKGAFEAVRVHFKELGIDPDKEEFTAIGIGDMSGDVFGNGMLISKHTKLLAAFNHKHIFIDPDPEAASAFSERKRLFETPFSQWSDYNPEFISAGGGVYERTQKEIPISRETQTALDIDDNILSGEELIKAILKAPVDLLWNGGIGTYVKASSEINISVGDPANDEVRIDASELRAHAVGEGGNLGFTQKARFEFAKLGGHINTDAVDNSGGVDLSDLEVNIKILLSAPLERGEISFDKRNKIMSGFSTEACNKVLQRNIYQAKMLGIAITKLPQEISYYRGLVSTLEELKLLHRQREDLPEDKEFISRPGEPLCMTRPSIAVVAAHKKMQFFQTLMKSPLLEEPFLKNYLLNYFPKKLKENFSKDIESHPLRREIIATQIANAVVERAGPTFIYHIEQETGLPQRDILAAYLVGDKIIGAYDLIDTLGLMCTKRSIATYFKSRILVANALDGITRWILSHRDRKLSWSDMVSRYAPTFLKLLNESISITSKIDNGKFTESYEDLIAHSVPEEIALKVASLTYAPLYMHIADLAASLDMRYEKVAKAYVKLLFMFNIPEITESIDQLNIPDRWEGLAQRTVRTEFEDTISSICRNVMSEDFSDIDKAIDEYLEPRKEIMSRYHSSLESFRGKQINIPALVVIAKQLRAISKTPFKTA